MDDSDLQDNLSKWITPDYSFFFFFVIQSAATDLAKWLALPPTAAVRSPLLIDLRDHFGRQRGCRREATPLMMRMIIIATQSAAGKVNTQCSLPNSQTTTIIADTQRQCLPICHCLLTRQPCAYLMSDSKSSVGCVLPPLHLFHCRKCSSARAVSGQ